MALQGSYTDPFGDSHAEAYHRINSVIPIIDETGLVGVRIGISVWKNAALRNANGHTYEAFEIKVKGADLDEFFKKAPTNGTLSPINAMLTAAYSYLKSKVARFSGMTNV